MTRLRTARLCTAALAWFVGSLPAQDPAPRPAKFAHGGDAFVQVVFTSASRWERRRDDGSGEVYATTIEHR